MRGQPDMSKFRMSFGSGFFYEDVREAIMPSLRDEFVPVESLEDYINPNILSARIVGLSDEGSPMQVRTKRTGNTVSNKTVKFKGSVPSDENEDRILVLDMILDDGYLTWLTMYMQTAIFLNTANKDTYLQPIIAHFMDYRDDIIAEIVYQGVRISGISDVELSTSDNGITTRTFQLTLEYNDSELIPYMDRRLNPRRGGNKVDVS